MLTVNKHTHIAFTHDDLRGDISLSGILYDTFTFNQNFHEIEINALSVSHKTEIIIPQLYV